MMITAAFIAAYLLGSLSSAIIVCKVARQPDPRTEGSKNPGASNVLRVAGKFYAALTLVGDMLKGFISVFIGMILGAHGIVLGLIAFTAVLGHMYPCYFRFKGGKGVATAIGCYIALNIPMGFSVCLIWIAVMFFYRYASLSSLIACCLAPFMILIVHPSYVLGLGFIALMIVWRHRENIERLRNGTESKLTPK